MILVLNYNKDNSPDIDNILDEIGLDYNYSNSETKIIGAEKIILPQPDNFSASFRKMSMMNLFSVLRIVNKPILGINEAVRLMCNQVGDQFKCGLGLFKIDREQLYSSNETNLERGNLRFNGESKLLPNGFNGSEVIFDPNRQSTVCDYSKAILTIDQKNFSLSLENNNYFGVELIIDQNRNLAKEIITNFCRI